MTGVLHHRPEDPWQVTLITAAAEDGDHALVLRLLHEHPRCVNDVDEFGRCALYIYANESEDGADSEDDADEDEPVPLDMVRALLAVPGVDVNRATRDGETPLWAASARGNAEIAALLLAHGATVDRPSAKGHTPLWVAVQRGNASVVRLLIGPAGRADVNVAEDGGCTPLQEACSRAVLEAKIGGYHATPATAVEASNIVRWLVRAGARPLVPSLAPDARNQPERILRPTRALAPLADLLAAVCAAGGWVPHVREPRVRMLLFARACARGNATVDPEAALAPLCSFLFGRAPDEVLAIVLRYWWGGE